MNVVSIRRSDEPLRDRLDEPEPHDQGAQLKRLYAILLRRWRLALAAGVIVFAAIVAYTLVSPRIYTATTLLMVNPGREQVISQEQMIEDAAPSSAAVDSEIEVLRSMMLSARLVEDMNLVEDPEWNGALRPPGLLASVLAPLGALTGNAEEAETDGLSQAEAIARAVNDAITVRRRGLSYGIEVSFDSRDPRRAAQLLNKLTELYLLSQTEARFEASQRANDWLSARLQELRVEVQTKERAAEAFRQQHGLSVAAGGEANMPTQTEEVQTMLVQARADLAEKEARLRQVQRLVTAGGTAESIATALDSPVIGDLRSREAELAQRGAEMRRRYSAEHPQVLAAQAELADVRQRINDEIRRITGSLQNEVDIARARLGTLQGSFGSAAGASDQDNEAVIQYRELLRDAAAARSVHESFLERFHQVSDQGNLPSATSRVVSAATPPGAPSRPNLSSAFLMALLLGGMAGVGLAFLLETLDASLSNAEDAERKLGVPAVASIPVLKPRDLQGQPPHRRSPALYLVDKPASGFAEAFRVLRTSLMHARLEKRPQVITITSAVPDEGKTTTSLCLARIGAMSGQRVLLVDCDLRRHSLSEEIGVRPTRGLLDVLSGEALWRDALVQDPESGAHVLATLAGRFTPRDVFESEAMTRLMQELRAHYDLIVLDSAPVLAIAETRTVAEHADLTLLVVRSDKTPAGAARTALREIVHSGANVAGVALNYVDPRRPGHGSYGDTLYYSYGRKYYSN